MSSDLERVHRWTALRTPPIAINIGVGWAACVSAPVIAAATR
jgi:hypothetical protein